jgi:hypothetical protein
MKLIAKYNVQVRGHIYCKGEAMEWLDPLTPRIIANFTAADGRELTLPQPPAKDGEQEAPPQGEPQPKDGQEAPTPNGELPLDPQPKDGDVDDDELVKRTLDVLKREGVMRQLDELGVTYPANAKNVFLARLLLMSKGEIKAE